MEPQPDEITTWEELAKRASNGLEVALLWQRDHKHVHVRGIDARTD